MEGNVEIKGAGGERFPLLMLRGDIEMNCLQSQSFHLVRMITKRKKLIQNKEKSAGYRSCCKSLDVQTGKWC